MVSETTGKFVPVGSGKLCFRLKLTVFRSEFLGRPEEIIGANGNTHVGITR